MAFERAEIPVVNATSFESLKGAIDDAFRQDLVDGTLKSLDSADVQIAEVVNIARALETLKAAGIWTVGLAGDVSTSYDEVDLTLPTALVVGAEGTGLRRLVQERCDWVVSIPMLGHVQSLNVSVATGIVLFEGIRQRRVGRVQ